MKRLATRRCDNCQEPIPPDAACVTHVPSGLVYCNDECVSAKIIGPRMLIPVEEADVDPAVRDYAARLRVAVEESRRALHCGEDIRPYLDAIERLTLELERRPKA